MTICCSSRIFMRYRVHEAPLLDSSRGGRGWSGFECDTVAAWGSSDTIQLLAGFPSLVHARLRAWLGSRYVVGPKWRKRKNFEQPLAHRQQSNLEEERNDLQQSLFSYALLITHSFPKAIHKILLRTGYQQIEVIFIVLSGYHPYTYLMIFLTVFDEICENLILEDLLPAQLIDLLVEFLGCLDLLIVFYFQKQSVGLEICPCVIQ